MIILSFLFLAGVGAGENRCGYPADIYVEQLEGDMAQRAAHAVERAGQDGWKADKVLDALVSPSAEISFGAGDVGTPMEKGIAGLRALSVALKADQFRVRTTPYIPTPADPCAEHKVVVEFISTKDHGSSNVTFTWRDGRIVGATGWSGVFFDGSLIPAKAN